MANPTQNELELQLQEATRFLNEVRLFGDTNAKNVVGMIDVLEQAIEMDYANELTRGLATYRASINSILANPRLILDPVIKAWGKFILSPSTDPNEIMDDMRQFFIDNAETVESRFFTLGNPIADGGNVGDGVIHRLTLDAIPQIFNAVEALDDKEFLIVNDHNSGTGKNDAVISIKGGPTGPDDVDIVGSGIDDTMRFFSPESSLLDNPSFDQITGTESVPTDIPSWASSITVNATNFEFHTADIYMPKETTDDVIRSLRVKTTCVLSQKASDTGIEFEPGIPYYMQIAYNRQVFSAAGSLQIRLGAATKTVVLAAETGWNVLRIDLAAGSWFETFNENDLDITVEPIISGGSLLIDDVMLVPYIGGQALDGTWYAPMPGVTPNRVDDSWKADDAVTTEAIIQYWLQRAYPGKYLPHSGTPTVPDPA